MNPSAPPTAAAGARTSGPKRSRLGGRWFRPPSGRGSPTKPGRWVIWLLVAGLVWVCAGSNPGRTAPLPASEYQLKAVFLFNFVQFVEWPAGAHVSPDSPIVIGIVGEDPFGAALDNTLKGETVGGRALAVRRFKVGEEVTGCQVVFVPGSAKDRAEELLRKLQGQPVLTVCETPGFAERGSVINFVMADKKVRFEVNTQTAARQGLKISSKMLQLAKVVQ